MPPRPAVFNATDEPALQLIPSRSSTFSKSTNDAPGGGMILKGPPSSDPGRPRSGVSPGAARATKR
jgi:hypothetical protein